MASGNLTAQTEVTAPDGSNLLYVVTSGTTDGKIYLGGLNVMPDGTMVNGKISVTVATNNITVALKTKSGGNPSATDPVSIWINGTLRRCTAPLSVTKNAGTNWFNSGAAEFATLEQDYFVYLIWNTTPATDIVDIGFARIPYGRVYSDFSGTTTSEKYLASAATPTATDDVCVVGRFAATLSATAAFNWSVPTFTSINKIDTPIYETRSLSYVPTWASTGTAVSLGNGTLIGQYQFRGRMVKTAVTLVAGTTTTFGTTQYSFVLPFTPMTVASFRHLFFGFVFDNSAGQMWSITGYNVAGGANTILAMYASAGTAVVSSTVPMTFATSDIISITGEYSVA